MRKTTVNNLRLFALTTLLFMPKAFSSEIVPQDEPDVRLDQDQQDIVAGMLAINQRDQVIFTTKSASFAEMVASNKTAHLPHWQQTPATQTTAMPSNLLVR